ncbi:MAG TPA: sulfatase-like hydrolase/transferase, partial [Sandaracinaceae bacterium]
VKAGSLRLNDRDRFRLEALYDGEITYHDRHFASVVEALERRGLADETLVVFTADHGEEFFDHGSVGHGHSVWEELVRVPLIVRWPGLTDGPVRIEEAVGLVDVMPTILEGLGLPVPEELSGRSIAPLIAGSSEDAPRPTVTGFMNGWRTIVVGRYKLIQRTTSRFMLYDLAEDPRERRDLAAERPIAVRYLRGLLGLALAEAERPAAARVHEAARADIDETLRAQLEALGYAGASRAPTSDGTEDEEGGARSP